MIFRDFTFFKIGDQVSICSTVALYFKDSSVGIVEDILLENQTYPLDLILKYYVSPDRPKNPKSLTSSTIEYLRCCKVRRLILKMDIGYRIVWPDCHFNECLIYIDPYGSRYPTKARKSLGIQ